MAADQSEVGALEKKHTEQARGELNINNKYNVTLQDQIPFNNLLSIHYRYTTIQMGRCNAWDLHDKSLV